MSSRLDDLERIVGSVSRETVEKLGALEQMVGAWTASTNLIARSTLGDIWVRHILDSAQLVPMADRGRSWLDLGSGGGFPSLVVAILGHENGTYVHMVESNAKKVGFLRTVIGRLGLPAEVHHMRIESVPPRRIQVDVITARALASLRQLLEWSEPWLDAETVALFHKGRDYEREIAEAAVAWDSMLLIHPSAIEADSVILEVRSLRRR